jgi:cytochrome c biogenesis protein CcmG/thiol:disulfide interchange protein DsbE
MAEAIAEARRSGRRWVVAPVAAVIVLAIVWALVLAVSGPVSSDRTPGPGTPVSENRPAPVFTRPLLRGPGTLSLSSYRGAVVVVNFWASWCRACRLEAADLRALSERYGLRGVRFVGVDYEDRAGPALAAARAFGVRYPSVVDPSGTLADAFGVFGLPMTFVVGPDLRIRFSIAGRIRPDAFSNAVGSLLDGGQAGSGSP